LTQNKENRITIIIATKNIITSGESKKSFDELSLFSSSFPPVLIVKNSSAGV
jgi:hypothetical protein